MSAFKITTLLCAAAALICPARHAGATDDSKPSLAGKWRGQFTSDVDGFEGNMEADLKSSSAGQFTLIFPYIEQNNIYKFAVTMGDINNDGKAEIITMTDPKNGDTLFLTIDAVYLPAVKTGESPMMVGTYEVVRIDALGNSETIDFGTLGIIAILIG